MDKPTIYRPEPDTDEKKLDRYNISEKMLDDEIKSFQQGVHKDKTLEQYILEEKTKKEYIMNLFLQNDPS